MTDTTDTLAPIVASLVPENQRMAFLPTFFGTQYMFRGEHFVYYWLSRLAPAYKGGYWEFYTLSNGGFYLAPSSGTRRYRLQVEGNGFDGEMSADAAGVVATLFAVNHLAHETRDDRIIDLYCLLFEFARRHPEANVITRAID